MEIDTSLLESVDTDIQEIADPLVQRRQELLDYREKLTKAREKADEVLRRIERPLKSLRPDLFKTERPAKRANSGQGHIGQRRSNGTATGFGVTVEVAERYVTEIMNQTNNGTDPELFVTQKGVYENVEGGDQGKASSTFKYLRKIGFLRKGGYDEGSRREKWYVDNPAAFADELAKLNAENNDG